jgi:hypothetical protein
MEELIGNKDLPNYTIGCSCHMYNHQHDSEDNKWIIYDTEGGIDRYLICHCCNAYNYITHSSNIEESNLIWYNRKLFDEDLEILRSFKGKVNRIPGGQMFRSKATQNRILNQVKEFIPNNFTFHPKTFIMPEDYDKYVEHAQKTNELMIFKPAEGSMGVGISLIRSPSELPESYFEIDAVVQKYVENPLLINNKKWDMRIIVLITGVNPMKCYFSTEYGGYGRFCTEDYNIADTQNSCSFLTNYYINRHSDKYVKSNEETESEEMITGKMCLVDLWKIIQKYYPHVNIEEDICLKIKNLVKNVISTCRGHLELKFNEFTKQDVSKEDNDKFYQHLGFDVMLDENFDPHLCEVDAYPSMNILFQKPNCDGTEQTEI